MSRKMKDSGIEWIGEIPEGWKTIKIKRIFKVINGTTPKSNNTEFWDGDIVWITPADMNKKTTMIYSSNRTITLSGLNSCGLTLIPENSIIISSRAPIGQVCISGIELCTNQGCKSLVGILSNDYKYYYYFMLIQTEILNMLGRGTTFLELSSFDLANYIITFPTLEEQVHIATYLNQKCSKIDEIIEKQKQVIEKLREYKQSVITEAVTKGLNPNVKMKDSGIEWIGKIPEDWEERKLKSLGQVKGRIGFKGYTVNDIVGEETTGRAIVIGGTNIMREGYISYEKITYLSEKKYLESPEIILHGGEILITKVGAGTGENAIYEDINQRVTINPNVMIFIPNDRESSYFINYYLLSDVVKNDIHLESNKSGAQPAINQEYVKNIHILYPTKKERTQIIAYLDSKCSKIDKAILQKESLIEKLTEYKKSLIYECVTGKKEV